MSVFMFYFRFLLFLYGCFFHFFNVVFLTIHTVDMACNQTSYANYLHYSSFCK